MANKIFFPPGGVKTFSDNLVGLQITDGSSQLANTQFLIDRVIPEKDSKTFHTQPFSDFLTLDTLKEEKDTPTTQSGNAKKEKIKFKANLENGVLRIVAQKQEDKINKYMIEID